MGADFRVQARKEEAGKRRRRRGVEGWLTSCRLGSREGRADVWRAGGGWAAGWLVGR